MRLLMWLAFGLLIYLALRSRAKRNRIKRGQAKRTEFARDNLRNPAQSASGSSAAAERMVACRYCQIYLPASEAIYLETELETELATEESSKHYFCCEEHVELYKKSTKSQHR